MNNLYQVLEVNVDAPSHVIKKAYRYKALFEHPDKGGDAQRMALLTTAYQTLSDPFKRRQFDHEWEMYNASNDTELALTSSGHLPTAGLPFSMSFRKQHAQFTHQYQKEPLDKNQPAHYLKAFHSDLYRHSINGKETIYKDIFSFVSAKENVETKLDIKFLTPEKSVACFLKFLIGDYSIEEVRNLNKKFSQKIQQLILLGQQTSYELQLYQGIYEVLLTSVKESQPSEKLLFSLQKITDYAKLTADKSMGFMAPLLQSKYFRNLFSQALHLYWLSEENVLEE